VSVARRGFRYYRWHLEGVSGGHRGGAGRRRSQVE
jgi:hypothetical protein